MTRNLRAAIFAIALSALWAPAATQADPVDSAATLASDATTAGTAAGIVSQCHSDSSPIPAAVPAAPGSVTMARGVPPLRGGVSPRALDRARGDDGGGQGLGRLSPWEGGRNAM